MATVNYETYKFKKPPFPTEQQYHSLKVKLETSPDLNICPHFEPFVTKKGLELLFATVLMGVILGICYLLVWLGLSFMEFIAAFLLLAYIVYAATWIISSFSYFWYTVEIEEYYRDLKEFVIMYETYEEFAEFFGQKHYS